MSGKVAPDSLVTLHYRIALGDDTELISTFAHTPATIQLGGGELAPTLEACLDGIAVGERHVFMLEPGQAFGPHNPELVRRVARQTLPAEVEPEVHGLIEFSAPDGHKYSGLVREMDDDMVLVDFNHPLAGKHIRFEVEIIGIL
jgi:FKBP-type peptidyl-prolyl cis-trans isomerase SlpA